MGVKMSLHELKAHIAENQDLFRADFTAWLDVNFHVWLAFEEASNKVWDAGWQHYSARTIMEVIRHRSNIREIHGKYKISNNRIPCLARLYALAYPARKDLFTFHASHLRKAA